MTVWWSAVAAGLCVAWAVPPRAGPPTTDPAYVAPPAGPDRDRLHRWRWLWALLAGAGGATFVSGPAAVPAAAIVVVVVWTWIGRAEPASVRRRREAAERELPWLVHLLVGALESGCDVAEAVRLVCAALPGPAADLLGSVPTRLALGVPPEQAWLPVIGDRTVSAVGRAMVRAGRSGAPVAQEVARLADDLDRGARLRWEERARAVGVKAAVPLGLCLLPAFLLLGVVPLVAALLRSLAW